MVAFVEGNSQIGLREAADQVPYYHHQFWDPRENGGDRPRKV